MPGVGFSIEPGIYIAGEIGVRSEVNAFLDARGEGHDHAARDPARADGGVSAPAGGALRRELGVFSAAMLVVGGIIGSGIFFTPVGLGARAPLRGLGARRLGGRGRRRARRRAHVRGARRDAPRRGRAVRVPPRGVREAVRLPVRVDGAALDRDRRDRGGGEGVRRLSRALRGPRAGRRAARRRGDRDRRALLRELSRREAGGDRPEHPHRVQDRRARGADRRRRRALGARRRAAAGGRMRPRRARRCCSGSAPPSCRCSSRSAAGSR